MMTTVMLHLSGTETVEPLVVEPERLVLRVVWAQGHRPPPLHLHPQHAERFEVLEGRLAVRLDAGVRLLDAGEALDVPAGARHTMWSEGGPATATWECRPAGRVLALFEELAAARGTLAKAAVLGRYDDTFRLALTPAPLLRAGVRALGLLPLGR